MRLLKQHLTKIKWFCTFLMFCGALTTSLQLHPWLNFVFLTLGNGAWAIILITMREWAAASVFVIMFSTWTIGLLTRLL